MQDLCQLIDGDVTDRDRKRLEPHLSNWKKLNKYVTRASFDDTIRMLIIELDKSAPRNQICVRLLGAISRRYREHLHKILVDAGFLITDKDDSGTIVKSTKK